MTLPMTESEFLKGLASHSRISENESDIFQHIKQDFVTEHDQLHDTWPKLRLIELFEFGLN